MATEFEAERESIATLYDLRLEILDKQAQGKDMWTAEEILAFLDEIARMKKRHK